MSCFGECVLMDQIPTERYFVIFKNFGSNQSDKSACVTWNMLMCGISAMFLGSSLQLFKIIAYFSMYERNPTITYRLNSFR